MVNVVVSFTITALAGKVFPTMVGIFLVSPHEATEISVRKSSTAHAVTSFIQGTLA